MTGTLLYPEPFEKDRFGAPFRAARHGGLSGLVSEGKAGRDAALWGVDHFSIGNVIYIGPVADQLAKAWRECEQIICALGLETAIRLMAPLLTDPDTDPAVVCVDETGRTVVALAGAHPNGRNGMGANALAELIALGLGCTATIHNANGDVHAPPLGSFGADLGFQMEDQAPLAAVSRALRDGEPVRYVAAQTWPLPALPATVSPDAPAGAPSIVVSDRVEPVEDPLTTLVYRPRSLVIGVGVGTRADYREIQAQIEATFAEHGLSLRSVRQLATVRKKQLDNAIAIVSEVRSWRVNVIPAAVLDKVPVAEPSKRAKAEVGTGSVAEAAALYGGRSELVVPKVKAERFTIAVARHAARGRLALIDAADMHSVRATSVLARAAVVLGTEEQLAKARLRPGTRTRCGEGTADAAAEDRLRIAAATAAAGHAVALIGASLADLAGTAIDPDVDLDLIGAVDPVPMLSGPLCADQVYIGLARARAPWPETRRRLRSAAVGEFVIRLHDLSETLPSALDVLAEHLPEQTPVSLARDGRQTVATLGELRRGGCGRMDPATVVTIGCARTRVIDGRLVTPRDNREEAYS